MICHPEFCDGPSGPPKAMRNICQPEPRHSRRSFIAANRGPRHAPLLRVVGWEEWRGRRIYPVVTLVPRFFPGSVAKDLFLRWFMGEDGRSFASLRMTN